MKTDNHNNLSRPKDLTLSPIPMVSNWTLNADESSFQATGDHFPTPPPMHEHKLKYEMNPIDGDRSVVEKKYDGNYKSFQTSVSYK